MADKAISEHLGPEYFENMPEDERAVLRKPWKIPVAGMLQIRH